MITEFQNPYGILKQMHQCTSPIISACSLSLPGNCADGVDFFFLILVFNKRIIRKGKSVVSVTSFLYVIAARICMLILAAHT